MRSSPLSTLLLTGGFLLGTAAAVGLAFGFEPRLSPVLIKIAAYKLTIIGALCLIAAGAFVGRLARRGRGLGGEDKSVGR